MLMEVQTAEQKYIARMHSNIHSWQRMDHLRGDILEVSMAQCWEPVEKGNLCLADDGCSLCACVKQLQSELSPSLLVATECHVSGNSI